MFIYTIWKFILGKCLFNITNRIFNKINWKFITANWKFIYINRILFYINRIFNDLNYMFTIYETLKERIINKRYNRHFSLIQFLLLKVIGQIECRISEKNGTQIPWIKQINADKNIKRSKIRWHQQKSPCSIPELFKFDYTTIVWCSLFIMAGTGFCSYYRFELFVYFTNKFFYFRNSTLINKIAIVRLAFGSFIVDRSKHHTPYFFRVVGLSKHPS